MNIHNLFPTPVAFWNFTLTDEEKEFVRGQEQRSNQGNTTSKDNYLLNQSEMARVKTLVDNCLAEYMTAVHAPRFDVKPYITQSWANYTKPGQYHHKHSHPNSFISGCVYIAAKGDRIYFYKDGYQPIKIPTENYNVYNSDSWWLEVNEGDVVLFPSGFTHMVEQMGEGTEERISIAFNTFLKGQIGSPDELTELQL